jgi:hypothetical protein
MHLVRFDLRSVFSCSVELATATADYDPGDHAAVLSGGDPPADDSQEHDASVLRWHQCLDGIHLAANRLKRALGAEGPLDAGDALQNGEKATWEYIRPTNRFKYADHPAGVRKALFKLANAAADLGGYAAHTVQAPPLRERGLRLLTQGLAQIWDGLNEGERKHAEPLLSETSRALRWPSNPRKRPGLYKGPVDIELADQYRVVDAATWNTRWDWQESLDEVRRAWARTLHTSRRKRPNLNAKPRWIEKARTLVWGSSTKEYSVKADKQIPVLRAFEAAGWRSPIPIPPVLTKDDVKQALKDMNRGLRKANLPLHFGRIAKGKKILWKILITPTPPDPST